ncbi:hypothetical protein [Acinetobacter sp. MD2]|uniref:hypothetical protein n=1 Tax=Acinetobacter sp. MD2 TaxID=2600066 RepID=UPI002D1F217A|nr:hypothetical protein [Acinetobacter sp. MD2]MEB3767164.1 hypothetical protein [Acinetobacter sp. MD2]
MPNYPAQISWKSLRVLILLIILLIVAINAWRDQNQNWKQPIFVLLHPVNADGRATTASYIAQLKSSDFAEARQFLDQSARHYRQQPVYFYFQLGRTLQTLAPVVPEQANIFQVIWWSLKFRFYAWRQHQALDGAATVTLYLNYYDPKYTSTLIHSTALEKGRIGSVNVFASNTQAQQNQIVITHELLHAFGASDKYDLTTGQPIFPVGYVNPQQQPLYPQQYAEIMTGHIPISAQKSKMADGLAQVKMNQATALEIGWLR